jgi:putative flippase GtrA
MFKRLLVQGTSHMGIQFIRYGFVAVAAFIVDFGLLFVFTHYLGLYYLASSVLSFLISLILNYFLSTLWVFSHSPRKRSAEIGVFLAINMVGLGLNTLIIGLATSKFGIYYLYSKLIAAAIVFFWSFFARRYYIFRKVADAPPTL